MKTTLLAAFLLSLSCSIALYADDTKDISPTRQQVIYEANAAEGRKIAEQFAPVFIQGIGKNPKADQPTCADFAGDFNAIGNWQRAMNYPLPACVYYSAFKTETDWYIFYVLFYPRDYKGGQLGGKFADFAYRIFNVTGPRLMAEVAHLSHENDCEGVLVVVHRSPTPHATLAQSLAHSILRTFATREFLDAHPQVKGVEELFLADGHPLFYVEPKGHGVVGISSSKKRSENWRAYEYGGRTEDPEKTDSLEVSYDLRDLKTFWDMNEADVQKFFAKRRDFSGIAVTVQNGEKTETAHVERKRIGTLIRGHVGAHNEAKLPWAWRAFTWKNIFGSRQRKNSAGRWFFNPAAGIKKRLHLTLEECSQIYIYHPYLVEPKNPAYANHLHLETEKPGK